jgi:NADH-quinone oxidoreductase subunit C
LEPVTLRPDQGTLETQSINESDVVRAVTARHSEAIVGAVEFRGETTLEIRREDLVGACAFLRDDPVFAFTFLSDITGVDRYPTEPRFEINYHLLSIKNSRRLRLKLRVPLTNPVAPSVTSVWPTANWHEREIFDLFGVRFEGHPNLCRILLPDEWEGHPLRKDYPVQGYR